VSAQNTLIAGGIVGALAGVAVSFLYFTEQGREWRLQAESNLDQLAREAEKLLGAVEQVRHGVADFRAGGGQDNWQRSA
jgi:gas vesicle protein